tara:strand:- start:2169 stop:3575 length:1407 start_codon:yes stop_codon:yes gene_type:complete
LYSQNTQRFTRDFSNGNVYGSITIKTKPLTLSEPYLLVRIENITIEGIKYYKGSDISFPINCKNCYADISGSAQMNIRSVLGVRAGDFKTRAFVNDITNNNPEVKFSEETKDLHNSIRQKYKDLSYWETTGEVYGIQIMGVNGAEINELKIKADKENKYIDLIKSADFNGTQPYDLKKKLRIYKEALAIKYDPALENKINDIDNALVILENKHSTNSSSPDITLETGANKTSKTKSPTPEEIQIVKQSTVERNKMEEHQRIYNETYKTLTPEQRKKHNDNVVKLNQYYQETYYDNPGPIKTKNYNPNWEVKSDINSTPKIDEKLKSDGDWKFLTGDYTSAAAQYSAAGDSNAALGALGAAFIDNLFKEKPKTPEQVRQEKIQQEEWKRKDEKRNTLYIAFFRNTITGPYNSGLAPKRNEKGWYGFVDTNDNWVIPPKYLHTDVFSEGKATVMSKTGKTFMINNTGNKL